MVSTREEKDSLSSLESKIVLLQINHNRCANTTYGSDHSRSHGAEGSRRCKKEGKDGSGQHDVCESQIENKNILNYEKAVNGSFCGGTNVY